MATSIEAGRGIDWREVTKYKQRRELVKTDGMQEEGERKKLVGSNTAYRRS